MLTIPGTSISLPADAIESEPTRYPEAWMGQMMTVRLYESIEAVRLAPGYSSLLGDWFALGTGVESTQSYIAAHAIPPRGNQLHPSLTQGAVWTLRPGTVINIGRCAPLFGYRGGGYQAEFLTGPLPAIRAIKAL